MQLIANAKLVYIYVQYKSLGHVKLLDYRNIHGYDVIYLFVIVRDIDLMCSESNDKIVTLALAHLFGGRV